MNEIMSIDNTSQMVGGRSALQLKSELEITKINLESLKNEITVRKRLWFWFIFG